MARFEFTKTLEANKLNKRTGSPINEVRTISYGAVIDNLEEEGDYLKFLFLGEPYRIRQDILRSALRPVGGGEAATGVPSAPITFIGGLERGGARACPGRNSPSLGGFEIGRPDAPR